MDSLVGLLCHEVSSQCFHLPVKHILFHFLNLETLPAAQQATVFEHIQGFRVHCPVRSFAGFIGIPWDLDETVVEAQIVAQRILPLLCVLPVVGELLNDEFVNIA